MIRFTLTCAQGHAFDSWFASGAAYERLQEQGLIACADCGGTDVRKALMVPALGAGRAAENVVETAPGTPPSLSTPADPREAALAALRRHVETSSEYVGMRFAAEARAIHDGAAPERPIYGEARPEEARKLIEEGIPVAPLPFRPGRKSN